MYGDRGWSLYGTPRNLGWQGTGRRQKEPMAGADLPSMRNRSLQNCASRSSNNQQLSLPESFLLFIMRESAANAASYC